MPDRQLVILEAAARLVARRGVRGLRMEELAGEAGVSTGLLYYHFKDRSTILKRTLEFVNERAGAYTEEPTPAGASTRERLELKLLLELQDRPKVVENSKAWGELRASALFERELQDVLLTSTQGWNDEIAELLREAQDGGSDIDADASATAAERLTTLVEGLSQRWLSGSMSLSDAQDLLRGAIALELAALRGALPAT